MTVAQLIEKLKAMPQQHHVVADLHSEYAQVEEVKLMTGFDNGGYVSRVFNKADERKAHDYVYIGVRRGGQEG